MPVYHVRIGCSLSAAKVVSGFYGQKRSVRQAVYPKSVIRDFSCKKSDYSRLFHRYSIYILTQYASFILFQDKMKAKFSNDRFGFRRQSPHFHFIAGSILDVKPCLSQALPFYATETKTTDPTERRIKNVGYARSWEKEKWKLNSLSSGIRIKSDKMIYSE